MSERDPTEPEARRRDWRRGRWSGLRFALAWRLREWLGLHLYGIFTRPLTVSSVAAPHRLDGYSHQIFEAEGADELTALAADPRLGLDESFIRDALDKGDACSAILHEGTLVSYSWMAFTPTHDERGVHVEFGPEFRYLYKAFTLPEYRGRHALRLFKSLRDDYCVQRGRSAAITFIAIDNDPSMKAAYGTGNQRIGFAGFIKLGPAFFTFRSARVRAVGFRFFTPGARPAPPQGRPDMMPSP